MHTTPDPDVLFSDDGAGRWHTHGQWTEEHAAARVKVGTQRDRALRHHHASPDGLTDHELGALMGRPWTTAGSRRGELVEVGLIERTTETRPSPYGLPCIVWRITPAGAELAAARNAAEAAA